MLAKDLRQPVETAMSMCAYVQSICGCISEITHQVLIQIFFAGNEHGCEAWFAYRVYYNTMYDIFERFTNLFLWGV